MSAVLVTPALIMLTFSFKSKVADPADVGPHIRVGPDVFFQHARLLTANAALLANVFPPASTSDIHVVFIGLKAGRQKQFSHQKTGKTILKRLSMQALLD